MADKLLNWVKKELKRHFTIMLVSHSGLKPIRVSFTVSFILCLFFAWTGITIWAGYISSKHIDYWRVRAEHNLMRLRMALVARQLNESKEYLDQVKDGDYQIRQLLEMGTKENVITEEATGGPSFEERVQFEATLNDAAEITTKDLHKQVLKLKEISRARLGSIEEVMRTVDFKRSLYRSTPNMWPVSGRLTSGYGFRNHPVHGTFEMHTGIDIAAERNTPVMATADGKVTFCGWVAGYGNLVIVDHGNNYETYYAHLNKSNVRVGQTVKRGDVIAAVGNTGSSTGYHLHYEVRFNNKSLNPRRFLDEDNFFTRGR